MSEQSTNDTFRPSETDWDMLRNLPDEQINYEDIPPLREDFFKNARLRLPKPKRTITIRLDDEVVEWLKSQGKGYQTRINAILRLYMEAQQNK